MMRYVLAGWAHVVCALYIPEVSFGNVSTMEPIILKTVPPDRFSKVHLRHRSFTTLCPHELLFQIS